MYLLTFKKHKHIKNYFGGVWEVVGQSFSSSRVGSLKAKARYEEVDGQRCDVKELNEIRSINLDVAYLEEIML